MSENSSLTYSRCNPLVSTDCVIYQGDNKTCVSDTSFTICKGTNMSSLQEEIFEKLCEILGVISLKDVKLSPNTPNCDLIPVWVATDTKTTASLFNYLLEVVCSQKAQIDAIDLDNINPLMEGVSLCCCTITCDEDPPLRLQEILKLLVACICKAQTKADNALEIAKQAMADVNILFGLIHDSENGLLKFKSDQVSLNTVFSSKTSCLPICE